MRRPTPLEQLEELVRRAMPGVHVRAIDMNNTPGHPIAIVELTWRHGDVWTWEIWSTRGVTEMVDMLRRDYLEFMRANA